MCVLGNNISRALLVLETEFGMIIALIYVLGSKVATISLVGMKLGRCYKAIMENQAIIKLNYPLNEYVNQNELEINFSEGTLLGEVFSRIGIPDDSVGFAVVKDTMVYLNYSLQKGDFIRVYPLVNGG